MNDRANRDRDGGRSIREVLERATRVPRPDTGALLARVPAVLAEAERRALRARPEDAWSAMVPMARWALPRLAAVAALFVVLAVGLHWTGGATQTAGSPTLEGLILTGDESELADGVVLETILENGNG